MIKNLSDSLCDQRDKFKQKQREVKSWGQDLRTMRLNRDASEKAINKYTSELLAIEANVDEMKKQVESEYVRKATKLAADKSALEDQISALKLRYTEEMNKKEESDAAMEKCKATEVECDAKYREPERQLRKLQHLVIYRLSKQVLNDSSFIRYCVNCSVR
jgi:chromosome segregation ATPase